MISVEVTGGRSVDRRWAEETVYWCVRKLLPRVKNLEIYVSINNLDVSGYCMKVSDKQYEIEIAKGMSMIDFVSTICHEMVHVRQFFRKQLKHSGDEWIWKASRKSATKRVHDEEYDNAPHEIEAHELEMPLALEFIKQCRLGV